MKIKKEHFLKIKSDIDNFLKNRPELKIRYKNEKLSKERFAWDIFWACIDVFFAQKVLYQYLNDSHIETALFKIIGDY